MAKTGDLLKNTLAQEPVLKLDLMLKSILINSTEIVPKEHKKCLLKNKHWVNELIRSKVKLKYL